MKNKRSNFYLKSDITRRLRVNRRKRIVVFFLGFILTASTVAVLIFVLWGHFINSTVDVNLKNENKILKANYEIINKKLKLLEATLNDIQNRDDNLYRFLLNADPLPKELRNSGIGGVNRYKNLENLPNAALIKNTTKTLDNLLKKTYLQSNSLDEIESLAKAHDKLLSSIPAIMPIKKELLRSNPSGYGMRLHPVLKIYRLHKGMDFSVPSGSEIYATGDGVVKKARRSRGYGNHVVIKHNYGNYETVYAHMMRSIVKKGQKVKRGDVIGFVGNTGMSTAPHVHYEVHKNGKVLNPISFYTNDLTPEEYEEIIDKTNSNVQSFD